MIEEKKAILGERLYYHSGKADRGCGSLLSIFDDAPLSLKNILPWDRLGERE
jgi:hypothetical protein